MIRLQRKEECNFPNLQKEKIKDILRTKMTTIFQNQILNSNCKQGEYTEQLRIPTKTRKSQGKYRSNTPEVFLGKGALKICGKFAVEQLLCNFIEITLRHVCSPVNLLHIFRTPFPKNTSGELLLGNSNKISNSEESLSLKGSLPINKILKHTSN